ncbi:ABC transporter glutamine-binding protein GlnH, partial [Apophysomyces sp. BC1015]
MLVKHFLSVACMTLSTTLAVLPISASAQTPDALRVLTDATYPPMEFMENGKRTGFDIDLMNALAQAMDKPIQWTDIDFKGLIPGVKSKRYDVAISGIYCTTDERSKAVNFSDPYYAGGMVVLVRSDSPIQTVGELNGKKVSVQVGTKSVNFLKDNYPKIERIEVEKNQEMFDLVGIGRAAAAVTGKPAALRLIMTRPGFRLLSGQLTTEKYCIAVRKDQPELTSKINAALKEIKANGKYAEIVE